MVGMIVRAVLFMLLFSMICFILACLMSGVTLPDLMRGGR